MQITPLKAPSHGKVSTLSKTMWKNTLKVIVDTKKEAKRDANNRVLLQCNNQISPKIGCNNVCVDLCKFKKRQKHKCHEQISPLHRRWRDFQDQICSRLLKKVHLQTLEQDNILNPTIQNWTCCKFLVNKGEMIAAMKSIARKKRI